MRERAERALRQDPDLPPDKLRNLANHAETQAARYAPQRRVKGSNEWVDNPEHNPAEHKEWVRLAIDANKAAAPYYSPRMSAVAVVHRHIDPAKMSDEELDVVEAILERASIAGGDQDREGSTSH